jgi:hypothetical protein
LQAIDIAPDFWGLEIPADEDVPPSEMGQPIFNHARLAR